MLEDMTVLLVVFMALFLVCRRIYLRVSKKNGECGCVSKEECSVLQCKKEYNLPGIYLK